LGVQSTSVAIMGGGVIGGGQEVDAPPPTSSLKDEEGDDDGNADDASYSMSLLYGAIPSTAAATGFCVTNGGLPSSSSGGSMTKPPSYLLFADPWAPLEKIIESLEGKKQGEEEAKKFSPVIAGGISSPLLTPAGIVADNCDSTVALDGAALPRGSAVGISLTGSLGLQTIVAQGCRGVGPSFTVTSVASTEPGAGRGEDGMEKLQKGNVIMTLDNQPALELLQQVTERANDEDKTLLRSGWLLCGISEESASPPVEDTNIQAPRDFLIRQVVGLVPEPKAIVVGARVSVGDTFRFHVRAANTAKDDLKLMISRAKTERLFFSTGSSAGVPLAAVQVSCVGRGKGLYGRSNVDLEIIEELVDGAVAGSDDDDHDEEPPVAGFFANGEIGPVGLTGFGNDVSSGTFVHGFTTVVAVLSDFSEDKKKRGDTSSQPASSTFDDMEEDAWG